MEPAHELLFDRNGELLGAARELPRIRAAIASLPETASTFRLTQIDDVDPSIHRDIHVEFCGGWRVHEIYAPQRDRMFVNPGYVNVHQYTDVVVDCECGARLSRNYDSDHNSVRNAHEHADDCQPFHRLRARAEMSELRYETATRCIGTLGWTGRAVARRLGIEPSSIGQTMQLYDVTVTELRNQYRADAAQTYRYGVDTLGESAQLMADIFGVCPTTLTRWERTYLEAD